MTNIDPAIRTALAKTWLVSDRGRLMAGAELGEWVDALAPTVQGLIADAVNAARAEGYEQGKAAVREAVEKVLRTTDEWLEREIVTDNGFAEQVGGSVVDDVRKALDVTP